MPANKNQHFVPRCYLKPFTADRLGISICLLNVVRGIEVENAPVRSQCSRDYFYGEDLSVEKSLQTTEGEYAECLSQVVQPGYKLSDSHRDLLLRFWLLQYMRTEAASIRMVEMMADMDEFVASPAHSIGMELREAVSAAMRQYYEVVETVADLKVCLIRNKSKISFVTSDDPAVMTNRWHSLLNRNALVGYGIGSAGAIFLLPLSPEVMFVAYDGDVYSMPHEHGWVDVVREADVRAFNQHQFLNCRSNIYFGGWGHLESLKADQLDTKGIRPNARHRLNYAAFERDDGDSRIFRVVTRAEAEILSHVVVHIQHVQVRPTSWPRQISIRSNWTAFTPVTGSGFVRKARRDENISYRRVRP